MRILVVEDEPEMARVLQLGLQEEGHTVVAASNGPDALSIARQYEFDAIVLDVMLPGLDGLTVAQRLRESRLSTPILMLTAKDTVPDMIRGLDKGADDYLTKPFSFEVLLARLRALSRRGTDVRPPILEVGTLRLDPATHEVCRNGRRIVLTRTEFSFLALLMRRPGQVMTREVILDSVWGFDKTIESNTIDVFVRLLRNKIDAGGEPRLIHSVRGFGYVLREKSE
ncbi:MAG: response regulator transcription factor [Acidobacteriota bacterium]